MASEVAKGQGGSDLEESWMMLLLDQRPNLMDALDDCPVIDWNAVDLHPLIEPDQMRRGKQAGFDSRCPADRVNHCANRALTVGTCDMNELQGVLWFPQG